MTYGAMRYYRDGQKGYDYKPGTCPGETPDLCAECRARNKEPGFNYCVPCLKDQEQMREP